MTITDQVLVGVVTLNFNQTDFLSEAVDSVRAQKGVGWHHVIVDPGSTDGADSFYESLRGDERYTVLCQPDEGPADGLNKGLAAVSSEFFYYLNADDLVLPGAFAEAVAVLQAHPSWAGVAGHGFIIDGAGRVIRKVHSNYKSPGGYARGAQVAVQQATFFRTAAVRSVGGFNTANRICWDGELLVDISLAGSHVAIVDSFWGVFRVHEASITGSQRLELQSQTEHERISQKILGRPLKRRDTCARWLQRTWELATHPQRLVETLSYRAQGLTVNRIGRRPGKI